MTSSDYGFSAKAFQTFLVNVIDAGAVDVMPDATASAVAAGVDEGRPCLICSATLEPGRIPAFAILSRSGGYEAPLARGICIGCVRRHNRIDLRLRAQAAFHGRPRR